ncbi:universal stress protein [Halostella pelagica]|uniref:universal stress protein n=1 Tax=Halostella pelagica TaxID=2583824 RepID=UPI0010802617|nr:universal stress protein [Halostella pelagica]
MYERILLPTDGSEGSQRAIDHAVAIADETGATIHAVNVVDTSEYQTLDGPIMESIEARGHKALEAVEEVGSRATVAVETTIRHGIPHTEILAAASDLDVDVIVMGTNGRTGLDRVLLGSVAERVVREAIVPVTTVRAIEAETVVDSPEGAIDHATAALEDAGNSPTETLEEPYRGTNSWIVPMRAESGEFRVHVDAETGKTRIAGDGR